MGLWFNFTAHCLDHRLNHFSDCFSTRRDVDLSAARNWASKEFFCADG